MTTGEKVFGGRKLNPRQEELIGKGKEAAGVLWDVMQEASHGVGGPVGPEAGRQLALARTNLEQAILWFVKSVSRSEDK